jgi:hypothetical protein
MTMATTAAAGGTLLATADAVAAKPGGLRRPFVERPYATEVYVKDWGRGRPLFFAHSDGV